MGLCRWIGYIGFSFESIAFDLILLYDENMYPKSRNKNILKKLGYLNETF
jgi:hypothetical protein